MRQYMTGLSVAILILSACSISSAAGHSPTIIVEAEKSGDIWSNSIILKSQVGLQSIRYLDPLGGWKTYIPAGKCVKLDTLKVRTRHRRITRIVAASCKRPDDTITHSSQWQFETLVADSSGIATVTINWLGKYPRYDLQVDTVIVRRGELTDQNGGEVDSGDFLAQDGGLTGRFTGSGDLEIRIDPAGEMNFRVFQILPFPGAVSISWIWLTGIVLGFFAGMLTVPLIKRLLQKRRR